MLDITEAVRRADALAGSLSPTMRRTLVRDLSAAVGASWDWDEDSGEEWASLSVANENVAFLGMYCPLGLYDISLRTRLSSFAGSAVLLGLDDLHDPVLQADPMVLLEAFNDGILDDGFNPAQFSAEDLWWATHF